MWVLGIKMVNCTYCKHTLYDAEFDSHFNKYGQCINRNRKNKNGNLVRQ